MKIAKIIALLGVIAMSIALIQGFVGGDFSADGALILQNPWGIVSLVDLYVGFILFSLWIVFREQNWIVSVIWVILMMVLGFFTGALYVFITLHQAKGDWVVFFMGAKKAEAVRKS
mgnify:CR=1 FL=1